MDALRRRIRTVKRRTVRVVARPRRGIHQVAIALTFDDGPTAATPAVLEVLAEHQVQATFFIVGRNAERSPGLVSRIVSEGHSIGSHSLAHLDPYTSSPRAIFRDWRDGHRAVENAASRRVVLFRPPYGRLPIVGAVAARSLRAQTWLWTCGGNDWQSQADVADVFAMIEPAEPGDVVLLHDGVEPRELRPDSQDRSAMVGALRCFLVRAIARGQRFVRLEDDFVAPSGG